MRRLSTPSRTDIDEKAKSAASVARSAMKVETRTLEATQCESPARAESAISGRLGAKLHTVDRSRFVGGILSSAMHDLIFYMTSNGTLDPTYEREYE